MDMEYVINHAAVEILSNTHLFYSFNDHFTGSTLALAADTAGQEQQQLAQAQDEERQDVTTTNVVHNEQQSSQQQLQHEHQHQAREQPPNAQQDAAVPTSKRPITSKTISFKSKSSKKKKCSISQCTKQAKVGGLCMKHGGKVKYRFCNAAHCSNVTQKGGYCKRHFNILVEGVGASTSGEGGSNKKRRLSEATEGRRE